jgi:hypothetical protein
MVTPERLRVADHGQRPQRREAARDGHLADRILALHGWVALAVVFLLPALKASAFVGVVVPGEAVLHLVSARHAGVATLVRCQIAKASSSNATASRNVGLWSRVRLAAHPWPQQITKSHDS